MSKFASYNRPATGLTAQPAAKCLQKVMTWRPPGVAPPYNERLAQERVKHSKSSKPNEKDVAHNA